MTYVPHTEAERRAMLAAVGVATMEDLFEDVPVVRRFPPLALPPRLSELEVERECAELAAANLEVSRRPFFLGAGVYRHFVPATVDAVLQRGELFTAYTPYQAEASQGMLQAAFEYQSMICALTGMEVANASHYDGATALAEAVLLALAAGKGKRRRVLVWPTVDPRLRQVVRTYLRGANADLEDLPPGLLEDAAADELLLERIDEGTAGCVVQSPDFFGQFQPLGAVARRAHEVGALLIAIPDLIALGLFRSPGEDGADVVAANGQCLGIPPSFGGPHLGVFATRQEHLRRTVGRLVGEATDGDGERGYVLTLSTREQHIRRQRATSNICTNAALMAVAAAVYLATLGKSGLRSVSEICFQRAHAAARRLGELPDCRVNPQAPERPFFKEFVLELPLAAAEANRILLQEHGVVGGYDLGLLDPRWRNRLLLAVTETCSKDDIDRLVDGIEAAVQARRVAQESGREASREVR